MNEEEFIFEYSPAQFRSVMERVENDALTNFLRINVHRFFRWFLKTRNHLRIYNQEILAQLPNFVLSSNHCSHMDVMCLFSSLPLPKVNSCYAVAAADYFFSNDVIAYLSRIVANTMPFSRVYGAHAGLKACGMLMDQGKSLIIYPEGTRSRTGEIQPFKNGIGILMAERKEPVVPVYINGTFYALPKGSFWPNHKPVSMIVGEPLYFEKYESNAENWEIIAKAVEDKVRELKVKLTSILEAEKKEP